MSEKPRNPKKRKPRAKPKRTAIVNAVLPSSPALTGGYHPTSGKPLVTPWYTTTAGYDETIKTIDTDGRSELKYPDISLATMFPGLYQNKAICFDEFQVRRMKVYVGECSKQFYTTEYTSYIHTCVDLDTSLLVPITMLDSRANSKRVSMRQLQDNHIPIADFKPALMLDSGGAANTEAVAMDTIWTSCTTGRNLLWQGLLYYLSWHPTTKPVDPQNPPKLRLYVTAELRYRGLV